MEIDNGKKVFNIFFFRRWARKKVLNFLNLGPSSVRPNRDWIKYSDFGPFNTFESLPTLFGTFQNLFASF